MEFSKKVLIAHIVVSICLSLTAIVCSLKGMDTTAIATLAGTSFITDGAWGGFYYWKSKNENRSKYAQRFVNSYAKTYGVDAAIKMAEVVLKD